MERTPSKPSSQAGTRLPRREALLALDFVTDLTIATEITMRGLDRVYSTPQGDRTQRELYLESWVEVMDDEGTLPDVDATFHGRGWLDDKLALLLDGLSARVKP